jgi:hypothetical protein
VTSLKNIFGISGVILSIFLTHCCKKDTIESDNDKYIIKINNDFKISSVTYINSNKDLNYNQTYKYSDGFVKEIDSSYGGYYKIYKYSDGNLKDTVIYNSVQTIKTYFLNKFGLADSCIDSTFLNSKFTGKGQIQYHFNNENYLTSCNGYNGTIYYEYENGNKIKEWGTTTLLGYYTYYFQYNSLLNIINISSFNGPYLGKLNANLAKSVSGDNEHAPTVYQYKLNPDGLVIQRIVLIANNTGTFSKKIISNFEYLIKNDR